MLIGNTTCQFGARLKGKKDAIQGAMTTSAYVEQNTPVTISSTAFQQHERTGELYKLYHGCMQ